MIFAFPKRILNQHLKKLPVSQTKKCANPLFDSSFLAGALCHPGALSHLVTRHPRKLVETSATLVVTSALLVVTRS